MKFFEFKKEENKVGFYSTLIFHLSILIILLIASIGTSIRQESSFVLDFTKQEELEKIEEQKQFKQMVSAEVDALLSAARNNSEIRNVAVNADRQLKDDRNANPAQVYDDARDLQRKLDAARDRANALDAADEAFEASLRSDKQEKEEPVYTGPAVISYRLEWREATHLSVPAYKGYESGDVSVTISVNNSGRVVDAKVIESVSTKNTSLQEYALDAAKRSRFTASTSAPKAQTGEIVYRFIGQRR
ncbi:MAG: TonB family protein [Bacteroidales bacterium]|nr:TonB family protein [Bacteroidales bacterium]